MDKQAIGIQLDDKWNSREDHRRVEGVMREINQAAIQLLHKIKAKGASLYEWAYQHGGLAGLARQPDTELKRAYFQFRKELEAFLKGLPTTDVNQFYQKFGQNPLDWSFIKMSSTKRASKLFQKRADALEGVRDGNEVVELADLRNHFETTLKKDKRESVVDHEGDPATENYPKEQATHEEKRDQAPEFKESEKAGPCKTSSLKTSADGTCDYCGEASHEEVCPDCQEALSWNDPGVDGPTQEEYDAEQAFEEGQPKPNTESETEQFNDTTGRMSSTEVTADEQGDISAEITSDPSLDYLIDTYGADDQVLYKAMLDHFAPLYPGHDEDLPQIILGIIETLNADPTVVDDNAQV